MADKSRTDAELRFARAQKRGTEAERAVRDAEAEAKRIAENTARLRALRLAKEAKDAREAEEAAERKAAVPVPKAKPKVVKAAAKAAAPAKATAPAKAAKPAKPAKAIPVKKLNARNDG